MKLETIGCAVNKEHLKAMVKALDGHTDLTKHESGPDDEGHVIQYKYKGKDVFFAMVASSRKHYLVRALPGMLELKH